MHEEKAVVPPFIRSRNMNVLVGMPVLHFAPPFLKEIEAEIAAGTSP